ncbi:MAG: F0F1 ATP synthase subunit gamma [Desulfobulbaceae bacterium]|nr:F0F1 ATP synthase subunit gamma [Desulfobulbaceae bacterium]
MDTLQSLSKKISTTTKLQGIVKSMKTLAAVSIRQYEQALESLDSFVEVIEHGLMVALKETFLPVEPPASSRGEVRVLVVFGSDQGLCGRFNDKLAEFIISSIDEMGLVDKRELKVLVVGARLGSRLEASGLGIMKQFWVPGSVTGINFNVYKILLTLEQWLGEYKVRHIDLFFNGYERPSTITPRRQVLLPVDNEHLRVLARTKWSGKSLPYHRTSPPELFSGLIRQYLFVSIFRAQAESLAAEQAGRLRSLQSAEKNIQEHVEELQGHFRVKRQAVITSELLDLVAGFKAALATEESQE